MLKHCQFSVIWLPDFAPIGYEPDPEQLAYWLFQPNLPSHENE